MASSRNFVMLEAIFIFVIIGSLIISYNLYLYRYELEKTIGIAQPITTSNGYIQKVYQLIDEIKRDVSRIRQLNFTREIEVVLINTSWAIETWAPKDSTIPNDMIYKENIYKATLLVPHNFSIAVEQKRWIGMFLAAVAGTTLYINTDYFNPEDRGVRNVLVHELTHILQHLNLRMGVVDSTIDGAMAISALIEGDAGWTQHLYCIDTGLCTPSPTLNIDPNNPYISLLLFPYIYGENFVKRLYVYGGWELVNQAYLKPPISTSMVIKPEKYIAYLSNGSYSPEDITISHNYCSYGDPLYSDRLGEYYILLILARRIGLENALIAADGWSGDRVELYRVTESGYMKWVVCWNISWASQKDAEEFFQAYIQVLREEAKNISIYGDTAYAKIYIGEIEGVWEPGIEVIPPSISLSISINNRYVSIVSEIVELLYICKACG